MKITISTHQGTIVSILEEGQDFDVAGVRERKIARDDLMLQILDAIVTAESEQADEEIKYREKKP